MCPTSCPDTHRDITSFKVNGKGNICSELTMNIPKRNP